MSQPVTRHTFNEVMVPNYQPAEMVPVRGRGSRVWDQAGKDYVDFAGGIAVTLLGHCHPQLVAALHDQSQQLWHLSNVVTNERALQLAQKLVDHTFADRVFFCNSGAEANEAAFKLARRYAQVNFGMHKHQIVACLNAFHGRTLFTVSVGGQAKYTQGFEPIPQGISHVPFNDIAALEAAVNENTCAIVIEPIQGEGGVTPAKLEYLTAARALADKFGALLVFDEVQSGVGRSGHLYAYQHYGITPDVLTSAKGLGGGFPIGAMLATNKAAQALAFGTHGSTYGGNPLACAVADKVLDLVLEPELLAGVTARHALFKQHLQGLADKYGVFSEVRGLGLLMGAQLSESWKGRSKDIVNAGLKQGVWTLVAGPDVLRLAPALNIPESDVLEGFKRLEAGIAELVTVPKAA
jgi:acetylornithine/N-succinyldiaminopimelate aminotransferase